ncbi:aminodeoxychorismate synthase component I [Brevibacterium permense]|uniref:aminodeoxychorismate synthase component I n=1 Tax=Brevibacterium permense TaxID=234834 RepID=UPI0021D22AC9|nr:aminodeoxychorismate synthase component I [Brevibacterium permense]MCU4297001.1 aminodeoxychorismate synthase component I [Brevibacterium permense]
MVPDGASAATGPLRTLLIDNADSFTLNLFHLLAEVNGCAPTLVPNDWAEFELSVLDEFDNVVISPGPGTPERPADFGICAEVIEHSPIPVLGVCLGHQGIAHVHGGVVAQAPEPRHGRESPISHSGTGLFAGLPSPFSAVRYHSLAVSELSESLETTAWSEDGVVMALQHRTRPQWGVQFHPESIASEKARTLLQNFADLTVESCAGRTRANVPAGTSKASDPRPSPFRVPAGTFSDRQQARVADDRSDEPRRYVLDTDELPQTVTDARLFAELFGGRRESIWLDGNLPGNVFSRFSIMGAPTGPLAKVATASVPDGTVHVRTNNDGATPSLAASGFFDWLDAELSSVDVELAPSEAKSPGTDAELPATNADGPDLPFQFRPGWVGYLGYELKAEVGSPNQHQSDLPDAVMMFLDRALVIDHDTDRIHLLALREPDDPAGIVATQQWFDDIRTLIAAFPAHNAGEPVQPSATSVMADTSNPAERRNPTLVARHSQHDYVDLIDRIQREITDGETYEVCLTNMLEATADPHEDALAMYLRLRRDNPTPFGAFIRTRAAAILSTSPERFLRIGSDGLVESKPIKGTRPRGANPDEDEAIKAELAASVKDRSENLMIVDLVRHDLGRTAGLGSVQVDTLFGIESYATVHQMVSTVSSRLAEDASPVSCVRAAFPPGSMTGAPKLRTMAIIDELEAGARGVYSGAVGYFSLGGAVDLSVVIRTLVVQGETLRYGVGGAIVALSDSAEEYAETVVKAAPLLRLLDGADFPGGTASADGRCVSSENGDVIDTVIPDEVAGPANIDMNAPASGADR